MSVSQEAVPPSAELVQVVVEEEAAKSRNEGRTVNDGKAWIILWVGIGR